jgi:membrane protease YdiL (CAAX protease family)
MDLKKTKMVNKHRGWQRVLLIILPYFFIAGLIQYLGALIAGVDLSDSNFQKTSEQQLIISFFNLLGTFLVVWFFMKFLDKENFVKLGFETKNKLNEFIIGLGMGAIIMAGGYLILLFMDEIIFQGVVLDIKDIVISILLFIIVAVTEEVFLRGYILKNLMVSFNKYTALIVSSLIFSLLHALNPNVDLFSLANIFLAGILLGISYIHTKNLWFPIALHLSWNLFQTMFGFNVSGQDFYSLIEFSVTENNKLNGGAFGFEGSIFSLVAMLIAIVGIGIYYSKKNSTITTVKKDML